MMEIELAESLRRVGLVERRIELTSVFNSDSDELQAITQEIIRMGVASKYEPPLIQRPQRGLYG